MAEVEVKMDLPPCQICGGDIDRTGMTASWLEDGQLMQSPSFQCNGCGKLYVVTHVELSPASDKTSGPREVI